MLNSKFFTVSEVECRCEECHTVPAQRTLDIADAIREGWGSPVVCTSGARCPNYTMYLQMHGIPAAKFSAHISGQAMDIRPANGKIKEFHDYVRSRLVELDIYMEDPKYTPSWLHFQTRPVKGPSRVFKP